MILRQFLHHDPVSISYMFGCGGKGTVAVVDPVADVDIYLEAARAANVKIDYVIDTHIHADHISTGRALADAAEAEYVLSERAEIALPFTPVREGDEISLGNVSVRILATPGHTPEHITLLVTDRTRADEPWLLVTGHTLMVGDLGRTELAVSAEQGAKDMFRSVQKLKTLPDYIQVLPGAFSGSVCGRRLSGNPISTLGYERRHNKGFAIDTEADFIEFMLRDIPPAPTEAATLRKINSGRTGA
ncbi:MAG: MBL fold metallo-hydrolase [Acidobacteria bacterium]|nr:MBL fold metallo-hydrolase [Acidobacteriota bacterium]